MSISTAKLLSNVRKAILISIIALVYSSQVRAQDTQFEKDTVIIEAEDTVLMKSYASRYDPRKALLYAAVVPGLGQVYNKKYWKLPLVYGGFALIGLQINNFNNINKEYRAHLFYNISIGKANPQDVNEATGLQVQRLRTIVDKAKRERDFWIIMIGAMYILQMVDAHVDAHLKEFDLNPNLHVRFQPTFEQDALLGRQTGASIRLRF